MMDMSRVEAEIDSMTAIQVAIKVLGGLDCRCKVKKIEVKYKFGG